MPAVIDLVEPMGSVNNVVLRLDGIDTATADGDPLIAVVTSNESFVPGARTWLTLRPERLVLFAVGTETALRFCRRATGNPSSLERFYLEWNALAVDSRAISPA